MKLNATAVAIVIGFGLVASAIFVTGYSPTGATSRAATNGEHAQQTGATGQSPMREGYRHIYGNENAEITVVEFSDYECPFCSRLHPTLEQLVDNSEGKVNWEYRHLPLPNHRNAEMAAAIGECVGVSLGEEAFWSYSDTVFKNQRSINTDFLTQTAISLGANEADLQTCVNSDEIKDQIAADLATARAFGGSGTPFSVVVFPDGTTQPISGALPYENWEPLLNL